MGRAKLENVFLNVKSSRKDCFNKRCKGALKKLYELAHICGCGIHLTIEAEDGNIIEFHRLMNSSLIPSVLHNDRPCPPATTAATAPPDGYSPYVHGRLTANDGISQAGLGTNTNDTPQHSFVGAKRGQQAATATGRENPDSAGAFYMHANGIMQNNLHPTGFAQSNFAREKSGQQSLAFGASSAVRHVQQDTVGAFHAHSNGIPSTPLLRNDISSMMQMSTPCGQHPFASIFKATNRYMFYNGRTIKDTGRPVTQEQRQRLLNECNCFDCSEGYAKRRFETIATDRSLPPLFDDNRPYFRTAPFLGKDYQAFGSLIEDDYRQEPKDQQIYAADKDSSATTIPDNAAAGQPQVGEKNAKRVIPSDRLFIPLPNYNFPSTEDFDISPSALALLTQDKDLGDTDAFQPVVDFQEHDNSPAEGNSTAADLPDLIEFENDCSRHGAMTSLLDHWDGKEHYLNVETQIYGAACPSEAVENTMHGASGHQAQDMINYLNSDDGKFLLCDSKIEESAFLQDSNAHNVSNFDICTEYSSKACLRGDDGGATAVSLQGLNEHK